MTNSDTCSIAAGEMHCELRPVVSKATLYNYHCNNHSICLHFFSSNFQKSENSAAGYKVWSFLIKEFTSFYQFDGISKSKNDRTNSLSIRNRKYYLKETMIMIMRNVSRKKTDKTSNAVNEVILNANKTIFNEVVLIYALET